MQKSYLAILSLGFILIQSCGVKTDPVPPLKPVEIGTGKPLYKGSSLDNEEEQEFKKNNQNKKQNDE